MVTQIARHGSTPGFTAPAGWTLVSDRSISSALRQAVVKVAGVSDALASASDAALATAGASGVRTATGTQSGPSIGTLLARRPAGT